MNKIESYDVVKYRDISNYNVIYSLYYKSLSSEKDSDEKKIAVERLNNIINRIKELYDNIIDCSTSYIVRDENTLSESDKIIIDNSVRIKFKNNFKMNLSDKINDEVSILPVDINNKFLVQDDTLENSTYIFYKDDIVIFKINFYTGEFCDYRVVPFELVINNGMVVDNILYLDNKCVLTDKSVDFYPFTGIYSVDNYYFVNFYSKEEVLSVIDKFKKYFFDAIMDADSFVIKDNKNLLAEFKNYFRFNSYSNIKFDLSDLNINDVFKLDGIENKEKLFDIIKIGVSDKSLDSLLDFGNVINYFNSDATDGHLYLIKDNNVIFELYPKDGKFINRRFKNEKQCNYYNNEFIVV